MANLAISHTPPPQAGSTPGTSQATTPADAFLALINRFMTDGEMQPAEPALDAAMGEAEEEAKGDASPGQLVAGLFLVGLQTEPAPLQPGIGAAPAAGPATPLAGPAEETAPQEPEAADPPALLPGGENLPEGDADAGNLPASAADAGPQDDTAEVSAGTAPRKASETLPAPAPSAALAEDAKLAMAGIEPFAPAGEAVRRAAETATALGGEDAARGPGGSALPDAVPDAPAGDAAGAPAPRAGADRAASDGHSDRQDPHGDGRGRNGREDERAPAQRSSDASDAHRAPVARDAQEAGAADVVRPPAGGAEKPGATFAQVLDTAAGPSDPAALPGASSGPLSLRPAGEAAATSAGGSAGLPGQAGQPHPASEMVSVQFGHMAATKTDRMTIQLRPVELGAVEVKLDFRADGTVQASVVAERPETLDLLQKDARSLEKALNDAGFRTGDEGLSFNLRGDQGGERNFAGYRQAFGRQRGRSAGEIEGMDPDTTRQMTFLAGPGTSKASDRVDIRI